jgi:hypothetical protein
MAEIKAQIAALDREYERLREMVETTQASGLLWQAVVSSVTRTDDRDCRRPAAIAVRSVRGAGEANPPDERDAPSPPAANIC